ncbi:MAG: Uma2 family endonuclease [Chloroflexota bacterium]|nr:Uma2 family endonuclease [Chloroflexota bacterium]
MAIVERERLITADEFFEIIRLPENENRRLELEDGEIVDVAGSTPLDTVTAGRILTFVNVFVMQHDLGYVSGADGAFKLGERRSRLPDVGFVSKTRVPKLPKKFTVAPDLAVEVVSEDEDIHKKALEYFHAGTRLVWAVYTDEKLVFVMRMNDQGGINSVRFGVDAVLDGEDVLPNFKLPVRDIFPV